MATNLSKELNLDISKGMLQRFLKKLGYRWKLFRKSLKQKQDPVEYDNKFRKLKEVQKTV